MGSRGQSHQGQRKLLNGTLKVVLGFDPETDGQTRRGTQGSCKGVEEP